VSTELPDQTPLPAGTTEELAGLWATPHWYGYLDYHKLYYIVACVWLVNLTFSTLWLRHFRFGPFEWCWRSLTYWKRQPVRLRASTVGESA
jgi:uncharacterized protein